MDDTVAAPVRPQGDAESANPFQDEQVPQGPWWRRRAGLVVQWALVLGALAALPLYGDELPDLGAIWTAASHADPGWLTAVVLAVAGSMGAFARLQRRLLRIGGLRMTLRRAFAITYAGNALSTTLPAGPAVSVVYTFRQFRRGGASARLATAVILAGGVITTTAYSLIGLLALLSDPHARRFALLALAVPAAPAVLLVPALRWGRFRALVTAPLRRVHRAALAHPRIAPHAERLAGVRDVLRPTRGDWAALIALALLNWVFDILALLSAAHAVGIAVDPNGVALTYFAAQAAGSMLPLLPGGLGAIEGSMAASLVAFGATLSPAAAAVGLYRLVSYWAVVAVGWIAWAALHEGPRVPARAKAHLSGAGRLALNGMTAVAFVTPYTAVMLNPPAEAPRS
ncbi:lysylphosphatidylglycerol synthase transmembrane domain-containing protein [Actinomadura madurae]|uniref:lysylphosphatidylglycerol synthase transmembrane domain-containing protein n=1 Tax=Actinomadura madurae TaxID=1993 RepID=UPI0020D2071D|nr:lysylphosphatidylglycerol synthase transmembrane domain-containing protein [Actinomadura madurae]MCP9954506.1 flippase-like domain-containing protein [Actinomadura madurae]MCP9971251.1 flippase-like domain-containing protein [Actinomadura madurae]MCQ0019975.1 flippase-like domain-containing protein [Actinomadura madurae]